MSSISNIFHLPSDLPKDEELFESVLPANALPSLKIHRIISTGQQSPPSFWYDQDEDEWVMVLQGEGRVAYEDGSIHTLKTGDHILIPAHKKHRVAYTSTDPACVWIAVHANILPRE